MLQTLAIAHYRSLRDLVLPLGPLNVVAGANGSGKSNVYRALRLLAETAQGGVVAALAQEGGLESTLWAGPEVISAAVRRGEHPAQGGPRRRSVQLKLGFCADDFGYAIDIGLPEPGPRTAFQRDPEIKQECIWSGPKLRPASLLVERQGPRVRVRDGAGQWQTAASHLAAYDSMLTEVADPQLAAEVLTLRQRIRSWRFYDHFRSDRDAPARQPQVGTRTPVLAHDGRDLAAAVQTILEIGDAEALAAAVDDAFPGAQLEVQHQDGLFHLWMRQHGLLRALSATELSDGTLRYLLWIAALLTPRPPPLMVLNEPETSLHPDLLPPLGRLIRRAARETQVWVVSHAARLIATLEQDEDCLIHTLEKDFGETRVLGMRSLDAPSWNWPAERR